MKSHFLSRLWNARELLFILLVAIAMDRLARALEEHGTTKGKAATAVSATTHFDYPSQLLLSSCKDVGDTGQISR